MIEKRGQWVFFSSTENIRIKKQPVWEVFSLNLFRKSLIFSHVLNIWYVKTLYVLIHVLIFYIRPSKPLMCLFFSSKASRAMCLIGHVLIKNECKWREYIKFLRSHTVLKQWFLSLKEILLIFVFDKLHQSTQWQFYFDSSIRNEIIKIFHARFCISNICLF